LSSWNSFFEQAPRLYEVLGLAAKFFRHGEQIGLMRFEEAQQSSEKGWIAHPAPQLVGPDSGQVEEPLRPTLGAERCGKRGKAERYWIIWYPGCHSLECARAG
jgi:hypothetical protein